MKEQAPTGEWNKVRNLAAVALVGIGLAACAPADSAAYYEPFTDRIVYLTEPIDPKFILHEEEHRKRASESGRIVWGLQYALDPIFRCEEEKAANLAAGIEPIDNHPACSSLEK